MSAVRVHINRIAQAARVGTGPARPVGADPAVQAKRSSLLWAAWSFCPSPVARTLPLALCYSAHPEDNMMKTLLVPALLLLAASAVAQTMPAPIRARTNQQPSQQRPQRHPARPSEKHNRRHRSHARRQIQLQAHPRPDDVRPSRRPHGRSELRAVQRSRRRAGSKGRTSKRNGPERQTGRRAQGVVRFLRRRALENG